MQHNNNTGLLVTLAAIALIVGLWVASMMNGASNIDNDSTVTYATAQAPLCLQVAEDDPLPASCPFTEADIASGDYDYHGGAWWSR